jgi:hypothetical protein
MSFLEMAGLFLVRIFGPRCEAIVFCPFVPVLPTKAACADFSFSKDLSADFSSTFCFSSWPSFSFLAALFASFLAFFLAFLSSPAATAIINRNGY